MVRTHGWGPRGQRLRGQARTGIGKRSHSLRPCGTTGSTRLASLMDGSTAKASKAYIEQFLVPTLSPATLSSWTISAATRPCGAPGHSVCRREASLPPPYSPDLNPIEQAFAKLRTLLRNAAEPTVEATWQRIGALLNYFTPQECANHIRNAGYAAT